MRAFALYSRSATPWGLVTITGAISIGLLFVVARWPDAVWPLHGATIGLLAGVSAWSADERCSTIVDTASRPLWWRTVARMPAPLLLVAAWTATHLAVRDRLPDHLVVLVLQGASAAAAGFSAATWQRSRGRAEPGQGIASFACPVLVAAALARPWHDRLPLFPVWPDENWPRATTIWSITGGLAATVLTAALLSDAASRRRSWVHPGADLT